VARRFRGKAASGMTAAVMPGSFARTTAARSTALRRLAGPLRAGVDRRALSRAVVGEEPVGFRACSPRGGPHGSGCGEVREGFSAGGFPRRGVDPRSGEVRRCGNREILAQKPDAGENVDVEVAVGPAADSWARVGRDLDGAGRPG